MTTQPDQIGPLMQGLLDAAKAALTERGRSAALNTLVPGGEVAWDNCCDGGGELYVRLVEQYPTGRPVPSPDTTQSCGITLLGVRLAVGVLRCTQTITDEGVFPSGSQMSEDSLGMVADSTALLDAIRCHWSPSLLEMISSTIKIERWSPLGPQGTCAGGEWSLTLAIDPCGCS